MTRRNVYLALGAVVGALVLTLAVLARTAVPTGSWGLHYHTEGAVPAGPLDAGTLKSLGAAYAGSSEEKVLYLTFDAGYENGCTARILDTLQKHGVPAAFFLVGHYMETNADLVRRMAAEGHTVANHTMHHPDMSAKTGADFEEELTGLEDLYRGITGAALAKFYRPPQGVYSEENLRQARDMGYRTVFWSLAYVDWQEQQPTREQAMEKLIPRTHNGAVVLLHSTSETNAQILDELLTRWKEMGYRFGTLEELFSR